MEKCDVCGQIATSSVGGTLLCRVHNVDVWEIIAQQRKAGKAVNAAVIARKLYREYNETNSYMLRDIPGELMGNLKQLALDKKSSVRSILLSAAARWLEDAKKKSVGGKHE